MTPPTEEQRAMVLDSLRAGCTLEVAAKAAGTTAAACRALAAIDPEWAAAMAEASEPPPDVVCRLCGKPGHLYTSCLDTSDLDGHMAPDAKSAPVLTLRDQAASQSAGQSWSEAVAFSAEQHGADSTREPIPYDPKTGEVYEPPAIDDDDSPELERLRKIAESYGPGPFGYLQMVNARCEAAKLHPMDPWWIGHFRKFYASGKMIDIGRIGLRGGKSTNVCRALVADVLYTRRQLEPSQIGVCPIMSAGTKEASDRIDTIMEVLRACGQTDVSGGRSPAERGQFRKIKGEGGAEVVELFDSQGHPVEFRVYPASKHGAIGFTAIGGFCDEVDAWRDKATGANPATEILEMLMHRFTTQPAAHLYIFSATYGGTSAHTKRVGKGDTPLQYVARLGARGAQADAEARYRLVARAGPDPALLAAADPKSPNVPCWVTSPIAPISRCYDLTEGDVAKMMLYYGGRPSDEGGDFETGDLDIVGDESRYAGMMADDRGY